jgi:hypothetical protein
MDADRVSSDNNNTPPEPSSTNKAENRVGVVYDQLMGNPHVSPLQAIGAAATPALYKLSFTLSVSTARLRNCVAAERHVENPQRLYAIFDKLKELGILDVCVKLTPRQV